MRQFLAAGVIALSVASRAQPRQWAKDGATEQDYAEDSYSCEKDTRQSSYFGGGLVGTINMQNFFNRCMQAHGWSLVSPAAGSSGPASPNFSQDQWNTWTRDCRAQATSQLQSGAAQSFAPVYNACMTQHGL
jgi:hypothetical protein